MQKDPLHLPNAHLLELQGIENFRDIGGYQTCNGLRLKWRQIFRCGHLMQMTPGDGEKLDPLAIGAIFDLRTPPERVSFPSCWQCSVRPETFTIDLHAEGEDPKAELFQQVLSGEVCRDEVRQYMLADYARMPFEFAPLLKQMLAYLLAPHSAPIVVHCTAGKDRTGLVIALLQAVLGVPADAIQDDYLLSNEGFASREKLQHMVETFGHKVEHIDSRMEELRPLIEVEAAYLQAAFGAIEEQAGSLQDYFQAMLELSAEQQQLLRDKLLQAG